MPARARASLSHSRLRTLQHRRASRSAGCLASPRGKKIRRSYLYYSYSALSPLPLSGLSSHCNCFALRARRRGSFVLSEASSSTQFGGWPVSSSSRGFGSRWLGPPGARLARQGPCLRLPRACGRDLQLAPKALPPQRPTGLLVDTSPWPGATRRLSAVFAFGILHLRRLRPHHLRPVGRGAGLLARTSGAAAPRPFGLLGASVPHPRSGANLSLKIFMGCKSLLLSLLIISGTQSFPLFASPARARSSPAASSARSRRGARSSSSLPPTRSQGPRHPAGSHRGAVTAFGAPRSQTVYSASPLCGCLAR